MSDISPLVVAAILAALVLLIHFVHSWLLPKPISGIPHNSIASIWGDIPSITKAIKDNKKTFSDYVADVVAEHGPILQITSIDKKVILLDETWKRHRRLTGPSMSRRYLERMSGRIASAANDMTRLWDAKIRVVGSAAFDADLDLQLATMDAIVNITMGSPLGCVETAYNALSAEVIQSNGIVHLPQFDLPPLHEALRAMMESIERASGSPFPMLSARLFTYTSPVWRKQYKLLSSFLSNAISCSREREAILGNKGEGLATDADCVLDMIIQREAREGAEAFGKGEMLDELMTYVLAGQDTTAASLGWLVKFLPQDPEIQLRLHNEVCNVFGPGTESDEFLDFNLLDDHIRVPILEAVVAETLRCAGVASLTGREHFKVTQDEIILDRVVPKGTQLMFTTSLMSTNQPEWGPDAKKWRPSRWLTPEGDIPAISRAGKNGDGLFADFVAHTFKDEIWKKHRRLSGPSMSRRYLERMSERIAAGANDLVGLWQAKYTLVGCSAFDPVLDFHLATMDGIVNVTLGHSIGCMKHAYDALPSSVQYPNMIVQREGREGEEAFGKENLLDELIMYILAGQDSTAVSLSWLFKYLSTNANVQRQLHDEMCAVFGPSEESNNLDFDLLDNSERVPILESVVAETMRCAGVAAIIARDRERQLRVLIPTSDIVLFSVLQDEVILGRHVPKGTLSISTQNYG
ncbi:hypothetical protein RhiTH_007811 [Rhizoctonia solani]